MIAQDFVRLRVLATGTIASLWWREHVRAVAQKTSEGVASASCHPRDAPDYFASS